MAGVATSRIVWTWLAAIVFPSLASATLQAPCNAASAHELPARPDDAPGAAAFVRSILSLSDDERETAVRGQLMTGNLPPFLRHFQPVVIEGSSPDGPVRVTLCVAPDYVAVGTDDDYLLMPLRLRTALAFATRYDFVLPTRKMVDAIYRNAGSHLAPQPLPASDRMRTTEYYWHHNEMVRQQRALLSGPLDLLVAGDKKDLVISPRLWSFPDRVAIYGWHRPDGRAIQPLSTVHGARYADYSHGVRLVSATAFIDGQAMSVVDLLEDPRYAGALSDEGVFSKIPQLFAMLEGESP